jgi:hypothetical protein
VKCRGYPVERKLVLAYRKAVQLSARRRAARTLAQFSMVSPEPIKKRDSVVRLLEGYFSIALAKLPSNRRFHID